MTIQFLLIPLKCTLFMPRFPGADPSNRPQQGICGSFPGPAENGIPEVLPPPGGRATKIALRGNAT